MAPAADDGIDVAQFIEELQSREHIWNHKLPDHFTKQKEQLASIARVFGVTGLFFVVVIILLLL